MIMMNLKTNSDVEAQLMTITSSLLTVNPLNTAVSFHLFMWFIEVLLDVYNWLV